MNEFILIPDHLPFVIDYFDSADISHPDPGGSNHPLVGESIEEYFTEMVEEFFPIKRENTDLLSHKSCWTTGDISTNP
ncbi:unnamed protein product [Rhizophagus irregularis]|nr:unnamed protein product [Rhizophagus irregularis]